jgi:ribose 5-phosphate isomerase B
MTIYFATDHAGFALKEKLLAYVRDELQYEVVDCGAYTQDPEDDYPGFIKKASEAVSQNPGASGQGEAMVANRSLHVRATVYYGGPAEIITLSRVHNDANVLSLGARFLSEEEAKDVVKLWLETPFSGEERHIRRITDIDSNS